MSITRALLMLLDCPVITELETTAMLFKCRGCGKVSADIDMILDGACDCGCRHFQLVSEDASVRSGELSDLEWIRKDLHVWLDLNLDSMSAENLNSLRVVLETDKPIEIPRG